MLYCCLSAFFFFFKQKTAYEMRISDWSSDVCSSDLRRLVDRDEADARIAQPRRDRADAGDNIPRGAAAPRCRREREIVDIIAIRLRRDGAEPAVEQIGRASCRERGCPNVTIQAVAGVFKQQKTHATSTTISKHATRQQL